MADNEQNPERDAWVQEPYTKLTLDKVKRELEPAALSVLLRYCDRSTDPNVRQYYALYVATLNLQILLATGELQT